MYRFAIGILLIATACTAPNEDYPFAADLYGGTRQPIDDGMKYAPSDYPDIKFWNLDPKDFSTSALGAMIVHNTTDVSIDYYKRLLISPIVGLSADSRWRDLGFLPSPYRYQSRRGLSLAEALNKTSDGHKSVTTACSMCHAGMHGNTVVMGAPARDLNIQEVGLIYRKYASATPYQEEVLYPIIYASANLSPAAFSFNFVVLSSLAHLMPDAPTYDSWRLPGKSPEFTRLMDYVKREYNGSWPVAQPRPWWLARYSGYHFWHSTTKHGVDNSAADLALYTGTPNYGQAHPTPWIEKYEHSRLFQDYMDRISTPPFPGVIDQELADKGHEVYHSSGCQKCHGTFAKLDNGYRLDYPLKGNFLDPAKIGVDINYFKATSDNAWTAHASQSNKERKLYNVNVDIRDTPTIQAPPLIGLWASAPYMHNSSVSTVYLMLNSKLRPDVWKLERSPAFDAKDLGAVSTVPSGKPDIFVIDTRKMHLSNSGHTYGDMLKEEDRRAIVEFLKTVGTQNVTPNPPSTK